MNSRILIVSLLMFSAIMGLFISNSNTKINNNNEKPESTSAQVNDTSNRWLKRFYIGAVLDGIGCRNNYANLDSLGFNLWHKYNLSYDEANSKPFPGMIWDSDCGFASTDYDKTLQTVDDYKGVINDRIAAIQNTHPDMRMVTMRPKIEYLCYGQRSDYQCDSVLSGEDLWFYGFNVHETGIQVIDSDSKVMYCNPANNNAGFVVKGLRANTEQCKKTEIADGNAWQGDKYCDWFIKPRIRINSDAANSQNNPKVCQIIVIGQTGKDTLKKVDIMAKDFVFNSKYDGRYIEEFNFSGGRDLKIHGNWGTDWQYCARGIDNNDANMNKADIQVYWYGNCDMWIDYVRVDNDVADELFKGLKDKWIKDEVEQIGMETKINGEPVIMKYYIELAEFNNLPCMAYVNSKLKAYSGNQIDLIQDLTNTMSVHVPWKNRASIENAGFLNTHYIQKVGFTQIFAESYPFTACHNQAPGNQMYSRIPNTLPVHDGSNNILAKAVPPADYDNWLQDNLNYKPYVLEQNYLGGDLQCGYLYQDKGNFRYKMELGNKLSKLANIPFIFMPQAHQWYMPGEVRREPTNEEMDMMTNVAASYGAKGFLYFSYNSFGKGNDYGTGIVDFNLNLRQKNYYGQDKFKWKTIQDISRRIGEKWGPYLLKFDYENTKSVVYDNPQERDEFLSNSYFEQITTSLSSPDNQCAEIVPGTLQDVQNKTYIQAASFKNKGEINTYYNMFVNRRCSPGDDDCSGRRFVSVSIKPNRPEFEGFNNWKIIDLFTDSTVFTFDKRIANYISLGKFKPGEGKLYKIAPVMQEGGTLICDEDLKNLAFNCKGTVNTGGYNLSVDNNTKIEFNADCRIFSENCINLSFGNSSKWAGVYTPSLHYKYFDAVGISIF